MNRLNNPCQQSTRTTEATKVNANKEQLYDLDGNRHRRNTNINQFSSLFESENEEGTKCRTKPNTPTMELSEDEEEDKNKGEKNEDN